MSESNPYAAPTAVLDLEPARGERAAAHREFYAISERKLFVLSVATINLFAIYWCYKHWKYVQQSARPKVWPIARAIFLIFSLHELVTIAVQRGRRAGIKIDYGAEQTATLAVALIITDRILGKLVDNNVGYPYLDVITLLNVGAVAYALCRVQRHINVAYGDPRGKDNARFTIANWVWTCAGALFWALALIGYAAGDMGGDTRGDIGAP